MKEPTNSSPTQTHVGRGRTHPFPVESIGAGAMLGGRFLLRELLGQGASGTVYSAVDTGVGQKLAVKVLHPGLRDERTMERLRREVRASRPGHPHAVTVYDLHEDGERLFLSMELVEGRSLRDELAQLGRLEIERCITAAAAVASALEHLHGRGLVHRDVKPGNILITSDGAVKLCDMGLVRPLEEGGTVTESEMVVGTPTYMAPEQATGTTLTAASDVYSLGLTLFQCLTGEVPLTSTTAVATLSRRQRSRPPRVRTLRNDCPRWLGRLVRRMLAPDPRNRPSAREATMALRTHRLRPKPTRRQLLASAGLLLAFATVVWGARRLRHRPTALVEVTRHEISGRDADGEITWQRDLKLPPVQEVRADLDGDGVEEIILDLEDRESKSSRSANEPGPEIWIFDHNGTVWARFAPEDSVDWAFPFDLELRTAAIRPMDIDRDGTLEVAVIFRHRNFYPSTVLIFWPRWKTWDQALSHTGVIADVSAAPDDQPRGIRILGVNNNLAVLPVVGELAAEPPSATGSGMAVKVPAEPHLVPGGPQTHPRFGWRSYIPFPRGQESVSQARLLAVEDGALAVVLNGRRIQTFDRFRNPTPGPNAGRDLRAERLEFMRIISRLEPHAQVAGTSAVIQARDLAITRCGPLLDEPAFRMLLDLKTARALVRTGNLHRAREILQAGADHAVNPELLYRLAHIEAAAGDLQQATNILIDMVSGPKVNTRTNFDGPYLLLRVGAEARDQRTIDRAVAHLSSHGVDGGEVATSLRARVRLWWDQLTPEDLSARSWGLESAGEAIGCLARWRRGQTLTEDIRAMTDFASTNPDASVESRLARAAALMGIGDPRASSTELVVLIEELRYTSRDDFTDHQLFDLARALRVVALEASGEHSQARAAAAEVVDELTPGVLPAILVREVMERLQQGLD